MTAQHLYEKALRSYLLRKYTSAANTCLKSSRALGEHENDLLKINIWTLYLNIASTLLETTPFLGVNLASLGIGHVGSLEEACRAVWEKVVKEGFVDVALMDANLVAAYLVMDLKLDQLNVAKEAAEQWLAALPEIRKDDEKKMVEYISVIDLYITRILPGLGDFESAETFIEYNSVLTDIKKKSLSNQLQDQKKAIEKERQQKHQQEEAARLAAEEKRKEIEQRQLEEARQLRAQEEKARKEEEEKARTEEEKPQERMVELPRSTSSHQTNKIQHWIRQLKTANISTSSGIVLFALFALLALLRGQRSRLSEVLRHLLNKLWQTVQMGTKVTYM
ncbi:hypothetical protein BD560DRAFT_413482 [Blakeslea trispora]|nr:hypothetical protein BD560DRAFT_413482 [Blakeslea trispora]